MRAAEVTTRRDDERHGEAERERDTEVPEGVCASRDHCGTRADGDECKGAEGFGADTSRKIGSSGHNAAEGEAARPPVRRKSANSFGSPLSTIALAARSMS